MTSKANSPERVGIRGMELYFPKLYVDQSELEKFDNVSCGKYTVGLGQNQMSFCADHEDITSVCLTVVWNLLRHYSISGKDIGFLCVGTETLTDKSKSVKTSLMRLFAENTDIEGVDVKNACYGGTQALFHAVDWVYANWETEHKYAVAVMADIAVYGAGPARCTGGAGAFAALVGPNALVYFEKGLRATYMADVWDFYKPDQPSATEYPFVDGPYSVDVYLKCVDRVYESYCKKAQKLNSAHTIPEFDAIFFHCPYSRLLLKAFGVMCKSDFRRGYFKTFKSLLPEIPELDEKQFKKFSNQPGEQLIVNSDFTRIEKGLYSILWHKKNEPYLLWNRRLGNLYTASLYLQLFAFFQITPNTELRDGQHLLFFSYGSGAASAMFSARISLRSDDDSTKEQYFFIKSSASRLSILLDQRFCINPQRYSEIMALREKLIKGPVPYIPEGIRGGFKNEFSLFDNTFYLKCIDEKYRRYYAQDAK